MIDEQWSMEFFGSCGPELRGVTCRRSSDLGKRFSICSTHETPTERLMRFSDGSEQFMLGWEPSTKKFGVSMERVFERLAAAKRGGRGTL